MEKQFFKFFNWVSQDVQDTAVLGFYDCTLKIDDIGDHRTGEVIPYIEMNYSTGEMTLMWFDESKKENGCSPVSKEETYVLYLVVGPRRYNK